jgi:hypothetical protein
MSPGVLTFRGVTFYSLSMSYSVLGSEDEPDTDNTRWKEIAYELGKGRGRINTFQVAG